MFGSVRSSRQRMRMHTIGIAAEQWTSGPEGIPCIEQGNALHQLLHAVSESIRPGKPAYARRGKQWDDSFVGLPQSARGADRTPIVYPHTLFSSSKFLVFWGGICQLSPCILLEVDKDCWFLKCNYISGLCHVIFHGSFVATPRRTRWAVWYPKIRNPDPHSRSGPTSPSQPPFTWAPKVQVPSHSCSFAARILRAAI